MDLGCPACAEAHFVLQVELDRWINTKQIQYTFMPFALQSYGNASEAAHIAHCVGQQDHELYRSAVDVLLSFQSDWIHASSVLDATSDIMKSLDVDSLPSAPACAGLVIAIAKKWQMHDHFSLRAVLTKRHLFVINRKFRGD